MWIGDAKKRIQLCVATFHMTMHLHVGHYILCVFQHGLTYVHAIFSDHLHAGKRTIATSCHGECPKHQDVLFPPQASTGSSYVTGWWYMFTSCSAAMTSWSLCCWRSVYRCRHKSLIWRNFTSKEAVIFQNFKIMCVCVCFWNFPNLIGEPTVWACVPCGCTYIGAYKT